MPTIIVCTNFSQTSRNALAYACSLINSKPNAERADILLLHIFTIPANYSGDGIALVTINNSLNYTEQDLYDELEWVHEEYPEINVIGKITTGRLVEGLKEQIDEMKASMVFLGTGGDYGDLWSWDSEILSALRSLPVPVLTIPPNLTFSPLQTIAFACNLKNINLYTPFEALKNIIDFTNAKLHVVYVTDHEIKPGCQEAKNEQLVHDKLKELDPVYHTIYESKVVGAIGRFIEDKGIQLLLVMPKKHGVWESLFHKSHTKELARLNKLPIMALH